MPALENTRIADQPGEAARGVSAAAEAEEVKLVAGLIVVDEEAVAIDHILEQPRAKCSADKAPGEIRADAGLVVDDLRYVVASFRSQRPTDLEHIGGRGSAFVCMFSAFQVPSAQMMSFLGMIEVFR